MNVRFLFSCLGVVGLLFTTGGAAARPLADPMGTSFTYQGRLTDGGVPANGVYDLQFALHDAASAGTQVGSTVTKEDETVTDGLFTVELDFGAVFDGTALYLEIAVREGSEVGAFTTLSPRQPLSGTPYAMYSAKAPWSGLTGVPSGFADGVDDVGGTLTQIDTGEGLTGGPITTSGAISLANSGVTSAKIADNTVGAADIASGAVGSSEIVNNGISLIDLGMSCAAGQVIKSDGATAWACAVDDDTNTTYTAGEGLELDGTQFKGKGTAYQNVVIVAQSGGDFTSIQDALNSITDASTTNRYLIYVAPGVYSEQVTMKPYVDIEGSGELTTRITYTGSPSSNNGTLLGADNAELRFLTVENTGGNAFAVPIYNSGVNPRLTRITASGSGGTNYSYGVYNTNSSSPIMTDVTAIATGPWYNNGVYNNSSSPTMTNVTASGSGGWTNYGVYNRSSSPTMTNATAYASGGTSGNHGVYNTDSSSPTMTNIIASASGGANSYGVYNSHSSPTMTNSTVSASGGTSGNHGLYNSFASPTMTNVTASGSGGTNSYGVYNNEGSSPTMTDVAASGSGGTNSNQGVYNTNSSSPTMMNVIASALGGEWSRGVYNGGGSSPTMTNVTATASGGTQNHGVYNFNSSPMMTDVTASALGGTDSYGVYNNSSSVTMTDITVSASGGTNLTYGVYNTAASDTFTVLVSNSQITGSTNTILNDAEFTTLIGGSLLNGGPVSTGGGTVTCAGVYDEIYAFYASTCP
jgi:hypothetical protein